MDKLLKLLSENSGFTTAEIAAMLGEPEDYIKAQIKEYENSGVIKGYQAVVNWDMVDDSYVEALIELQVTPKKETGFDEMAELCMGFEEVESLYLMASPFSIRNGSIPQLIRLERYLFVAYSLAIFAHPPSTF